MGMEELRWDGGRSWAIRKGWRGVWQKEVARERDVGSNEGGGGVEGRVEEAMMKMEKAEETSNYIDEGGSMCRGQSMQGMEEDAHGSIEGVGNVWGASMRGMEVCGGMCARGTHAARTHETYARSERHARTLRQTHREDGV
ncbi:hypothetical protein CYMTET_4179 [Cymbomonas tetramitiformis]|uniref:Uncharacterized protein n=1 Tax=Cymbomonas tetramitiformis TaxID=36881 RepID=A0AAE0H1W4_9CHLO|nr:hypothetical protein CYMTET_4179 [Cymbomonas tetramitiformis]